MSEISTSLSSYNEIDEVVQKSNGKFSFVDVLGSFINNREFSKGYLDFKDGINTNEAFIWKILSCIGNHVGNVVYSNVLGYIDNVCNVDLCKVKALKSILSSFGLKYSVVDSIDTIPLEIQNIIDVMSINKKYLLSAGIVSDKLFNELSCAKYSISNLNNLSGVVSDQELTKLSNTFNTVASNFSEEISGNIRINETIDDTIYEQFLSTIYKNLITSIIEMPYVESSDYDISKISQADSYKFDPIYKSYGSVINNTAEKETIVSEKDEQIYQLKVKNNLVSFDEKTIVNDIYNGYDSLDNYSGTELEILNLEISNREEAKYKEYPTSKYAYYKEQKVYEYFDFIKNKFGNLSANYNEYEIDNNYFEFTNNKDIQLLSVDQNNVYSLNDNYYYLLDTTVKNLVYYTTSIAKLREKIKLQLQRNNMKGSFNLLSYVVNEYLIEFSKSNIFNAIEDKEGIDKALNSLSSHIQSDIEILEYYDSTEYYNISTVNSNKSKYKNNLNIQYWNSNQNDLNAENYAFTKEQIEQFYLSTLNLKQTTNDLVTFLSTIYSAGANTSYIDNDGIQHITSNDELSDSTTEMVNQFSGTRENGVLPQYNHKNKTHSSYQIHPYLYSFIEATNYNKIIDNGYYNDVVQQVEDEIVLSGLSSDIGEFGQLINVALHNQYDFTGYRTLYEKSIHYSTKSYNGNTSEVIDYPGAFYPDAVYMYLANKESSINSLLSGEGEFYNRFYSHLNLSYNERKRISDQLNEYYDLIEDIVSSKTEEKDVWDIFKYGRDTYDNHYILYKKYDIPYGTEITIKDKKDTTGELWIRLNNHPIAFPALAGNYPQIATQDDYINGKFFSDIAEKQNETNKENSNTKIIDRFDKFYDMEFDTGKSILFLAYYPINDNNKYYNGDGSKENVGVFNDPILNGHKEVYKDYEHAAFIICQINQQYNADDNIRRVQLELNSNRNDADNIDGYIPTEGRFLVANEYQNNSSNYTEGYSFEGFYKNEQTTGLVFIKKCFVIDQTFDSWYEIKNKDAIEYGIVKFTLINSRTDLFDKEENKIRIENCTFENPAIGFNYYNNNLVFAILANINTELSNFQSFIGTNNQLNTKLSSYGNVNYQTNQNLDTDERIYNSFDSFKECIAIVEIGLNGNNLVKNNIKLHNIIATPSYIPLFPGLSGQIDISKCEYYNNSNKTLLPIQPLGKSSNVIGTSGTSGNSSLNNLINTIDPDFDIFTSIDDLNKKIESRVYENFTNLDLDESIKIIRNNTIQFNNSFQNFCEWKISGLTEFIGNNEDYVYVSIINSKAYGRNQYYNGTLKGLECDDNYGIQLNYTSSYIDAELSCDTDENIAVAGTYSIYSNAQNKSETNTIYNIQQIRAKYDKDKNELVIRFYRVNNNIQSMIQYGLLQCILIDKADLRVFNYYHLIDQYKVINDVIALNNDTSAYEDRRYYILNKDPEERYYLSAENHQLSSYTSLSDIPYLSGLNGTAFKFSENTVVPENHESYYYPGNNDAFPKTFAQLYKVSTIRNTTDIYKDIGGEQNTFVCKFNDSSFISQLGNVEIPILSYDSEAIRVFEDYLSTDSLGTKPADTIDTVDIRSVQYYKLFDNSSLSTIKDTNGNFVINFDVYNTNNPYDFSSQINKNLSSTNYQFIKNETVNDMIENPFYYNIDTKYLSGNGDKLDNLLNIYVNYTKDSSGEIELFFNYINYICTPYVKFRGEYLALDYIPGTYLRLKKGEDGLLDIVLQFKYYKDQHSLHGYKNVKVATYKIYNVSDDKPKFLIYKY